MNGQTTPRDTKAASISTFKTSSMLNYCIPLAFEESFRATHVGLMNACLTPGYVAIVGRPNAGKSTLVNAMVGQKLSIVTAKAQTTRHRILSLVNEDDFQMVLLDTPGILEVSPGPHNQQPSWRNSIPTHPSLMSNF